MIKLIGIIILSTALSVYGTLCSSALKESNKLRNEVIQLLKSIEKGIRYGRIPIDRIFRNSNLNLIENSGFYEFYQSECNIVEIVGKCFASLSKEDQEMLAAFFSDIGKTSNSDREINNCLYYIDYFERTQAEREKDTASKVMLYKKIGLLAGILCAVIFI